MNTMSEGVNFVNDEVKQCWALRNLLAFPYNIVLFTVITNGFIIKISRAISIII